MGAMQVLQWTIDFPDKIINAIHIAGALKHSAQNIAFHEVGRQAIMNDPSWNKGNYKNKETKPERGLAVARMIAHITYLSDDAMHRKFGRKLQSRDIISFGFDAALGVLANTSPACTSCPSATERIESGGKKYLASLSFARSITSPLLSLKVILGFKSVPFGSDFQSLTLV